MTAATLGAVTAVDVWVIDLDAGSPHDRSLLDGRERERADAFRFAEHRTRYTTAHAAVRRIVGDRLTADPHDIAFRTLAHGKPVLDGVAGVHVNLSHSADVALFAMGPSELGVDVEYGPADLAVAATFFSRDEHGQLMSLPARMREPAFLACWARKEAYLKAKGGGLAFPLDRFAVSVLPTETPRLVWSELDAADQRWALVDLTAQLPAFSPAGAAALVFETSPTDPPATIVIHEATRQGV